MRVLRQHERQERRRGYAGRDDVGGWGDVCYKEVFNFNSALLRLSAVVRLPSQGAWWDVGALRGGLFIALRKEEHRVLCRG